jgi:hypothetical protein
MDCRSALVVVLMCCEAWLHIRFPRRTKGTSPMYYELSSWQEPKTGEWHFSLLYNTDRNESVREVFDRKTVLKGLSQLQQKMSKLPKGSHIVWMKAWGNLSFTL